MRLHTCCGGIRLFLLQSEHVLLPSSFTRFLSVARFCSARSAAGLGRRDMLWGSRLYACLDVSAFGVCDCHYSASNDSFVVGT